MIAAEYLGWLLAIVICVGLPSLTDEPALALVGGGGLAVLWCLLRKDKLL